MVQAEPVFLTPIFYPWSPNFINTGYPMAPLLLNLTPLR